MDLLRVSEPAYDSHTSCFDHCHADCAAKYGPQDLAHNAVCQSQLALHGDCVVHTARVDLFDLIALQPFERPLKLHEYFN